MTVGVIDTRGVHGPAVDRVTAADVIALEKLLTLDNVRERFAETEPLISVPIKAGEKNTKFRLEKGWNWEVEKVQGDAPVDAFANIGGKEFQLTKDALFEFTSNMGLTRAYVTKMPPQLIEPHMNFLYGYQIRDKDYKAFVHQNQILAVARSTVDPFSNLRILHEALTAVEDKYGKNQVFADYKFDHNLRATNLRLIVPESTRVINDTGTDNDTWSIGVQILNSLIGARMTQISGYLFRWWCTNGAIDLNASEEGSAWDRRHNGAPDEVYEWARKSVDSVLGGLEHTLDKVQEMVYVEVDDGVVDIAKEIFKDNRVSPEARNIVFENLANSQNLNMYSIMNAITAAANNADLDPKHAMALMEAGGTIPHMSHVRCNSCKHLTVSLN